MPLTHTEKNAELEVLIEKSLEKVRAKKENDLCRYLPGESGGYMHHFTLRKLKHADPALLMQLLQKWIMREESPRSLDPKPRAPRGSRKKRDAVNFSRGDIEKVLELARRYGEKDLLAKFSPKRSLATLKRDLVRTIKGNQVNLELWNAFCEVVHTMNLNHNENSSV